MYQIIVNPASKSGKGKRIWDEIRVFLSEKQIPYQVTISRCPGDVANAVRTLSGKASEDHPLHLILLGGDGTVNEALQGISCPEHTTISYIPTGSSNDLARDLGISKNPLKALESILFHGQSQKMDIGIVHFQKINKTIPGYDLHRNDSSRYFGDSCGIGFDAAVCMEATTSNMKETLNRFGLGKLTYLIIGVKQIFAAKKNSCNLYLDDSSTPIHLNRFLFVTGMIHPYEGGGFWFCPTADCHDGLLDICVAGDIPKWMILFALPCAFFGKHYWFPGIKHYRAEKLRIKAEKPLWVHTDGEAIWQLDEITMECRKDAINLLS